MPPLYVFQAKLELISPTGSRIVPIGEFIHGPGEIALAPMEVLKRIIIDLPAPGAQTHYYKVGQTANGSVAEARLAWGSVGPTVLRFPEVEELLCGRKISPDLLRQCGQAAASKVRPISDIRASAEYRRQLAASLLMRLLPD